MQNFVELFLIVGIIILVVAVFYFLAPNQTGGNSIGWHARNGNYRVLYHDGTYSQPFSRKVAKDYAEMFGGEVVPKNHPERRKYGKTIEATAPAERVTDAAPDSE